MENVLSRAWVQVKWEEDVASRAKAQKKKDPKTISADRTERDEKPSQRSARDSRNRNRGRYQNRLIEKAEGMAVSMWPDISHLSVSRPELVNVLRSNGRKTSPAVPKHRKSKIPRRSEQTKPSETRNPLKDQLGTPEIETGEVSEPADREGRRDGSVHVARHLSLLLLKAGAGQCSEADGPADHSEGKEQGLIAITEQTSGSSHRGTGGRRNGRVDRCLRQFGRYIATGSAVDRSLHSDRMKGLIGRYIATD
ncbi:hypothetical protein F2Q69_00059547 [Brassica cretica]|uniref:Uncharacterized protein n=1 Tax=Brassica cretica TaxID=69181 RepID=A0A8S9RHD6_BRACR|nr:hypothetical protein F2Q69_00059547 [Brassica cretica]